MSVSDSIKDFTFNIEIPKTLDEVLQELSIKNVASIIQSDILLSVKELSENVDFMNAYNGLKTIFSLSDSMKLSDMNITDFLGINTDYFNDSFSIFTQAPTHAEHDKSIEIYSSMPQNKEELFDLMKAAVREVNKEKPNENWLKKLKNMLTPEQISFIIISNLIWALTLGAMTYGAKLIPYLLPSKIEIKQNNILDQQLTNILKNSEQS